MIMKASPFFSKDTHAIQSREALLSTLHPAALVNLSALRKEGLSRMQPGQLFCSLVVARSSIDRIAC